MASKIGAIVTVFNILAMLGVGGYFYYTQYMYKSPRLIEAEERQKIKAEEEQKRVTAQSGFVEFEPMTINLLPHPETKAKSVAQIKFSIEIRDSRDASLVEPYRSVIKDRLIQRLGKMTIDDVAHVQGRFVLRSDIVDALNELLGNDFAIGAYFTEFSVQ